MTPLRIVLISYEFTYSPFSGNGILSRSLVQSLTAVGVDVTVWCCRPHPNDREVTEGSSWTSIPLTLPPEVNWKRLDSESGWKHFVYENLTAEAQRQLMIAIDRAHVIAAVDWTGAYALRSLPDPKARPILYLNYRVFAEGVKDTVLQKWYNEMEVEALEAADVVVALSRRDRTSLIELVKGKEVVVLLPPLRQDIAVLSKENDPVFLPPELSSIRSKCLLTCVVRLSPEKDVMRFVTFVQSIRDILQQKNWIVVLVGTRADPSYADEVESKLKTVCPSAVILTHSFLSPATMVSIYHRAVLNFHPCAYEAYGMTIIEAGACGVPSVVSSEGVGATDLLDDSCIRIKMAHDDTANLEPESIEYLRRILLNPSELELEHVGVAAKEKALRWDELAYGKTLQAYLRKIALNA